MKDIESARTTFAQDTKMTPGIIHIIAKIADSSITTYKKRKESSQKYFKVKPKVAPLQQKEKPK